MSRGRRRNALLLAEVGVELERGDALACQRTKPKRVGHLMRRREQRLWGGAARRARARVAPLPLPMVAQCVVVVGVPTAHGRGRRVSRYRGGVGEAMWVLVDLDGSVWGYSSLTDSHLSTTHLWTNPEMGRCTRTQRTPHQRPRSVHAYDSGPV